MHIAFTGGGTGGHVVPNLAIIDASTATASYIGSHKGPERELVQRAGVKFYSVQTGKLRRYFDWRNFTDPFRVVLGFFQAWHLLGKLQPDVLFSKGGFVAVPVVWAAWFRRIPIVIHESDAIPGLATKLTAPLAKRICLGFKIPKFMKKHGKKVVYTGSPIRQELFKGKATAGRKFAGFNSKKPVLLVMGGSTGAQQLNELVNKNLKELLNHYNVFHVFGKGKGGSTRKAGYCALPYIHEEMKDVYAATKVCITRAGANSLAELQALGIPALMLPLGLKGSRGDQWANAKILAKDSKAYAIWQPEKELVLQLKELTKVEKESKLDNLSSILKHIKDARKRT